MISFRRLSIVDEARTLTKEMRGLAEKVPSNSRVPEADPKVDPCPVVTRADDWWKVLNRAEQ